MSVKRRWFCAVKPCLPPPQKRGFVFNGRRYEVKKRIQICGSKHLIDGLQARVSSKVLAIWYPVLIAKQANAFLSSIKTTHIFS